jgi:drug/metabolite transporter (DMT)-like permease
VAGSIAFSGKAIIVKLGFRYGADAVTLIALRMLFALPFFAWAAWWSGRGRPALTARERWAVLGLGFSGYYLASMLDFMGLFYVSASLERLVLYLNPTLVLLLGRFLFGRRISPALWGPLLLSYVGVVLVFGHEVRLDGPDVALGTALVFASALSYALYLVYSGEFVGRLGVIRLTGSASTIACVLCIGQYALLRSPAELLQLDPMVGWLSVLNGLACTVLPVFLVMIGIQRLGSARAAQLGMIGPLSTILMGIFILGEPFTPWVAAGTVLVLSGVWLLTRQRADPPSNER